MVARQCRSESQARQPAPVAPVHHLALGLLSPSWVLPLPMMTLEPLLAPLLLHLTSLSWMRTRLLHLGAERAASLHLGAVVGMRQLEQFGKPAPLRRPGVAQHGLAAWRTVLVPAVMHLVRQPAGATLPPSASQVRSQRPPSTRVQEPPLPGRRPLPRPQVPLAARRGRWPCQGMRLPTRLWPLHLDLYLDPRPGRRPVATSPMTAVGWARARAWQAAGARTMLGLWLRGPRS